jgi:hypothetical protein
MRVKSHCTAVAVVLTLGLGAGRAEAAPIVFSAYDVGAGSLAAAPLSVAAAGSFDATVGAFALIDFESGLPAGVGMSAANIVSVGSCGAALCGYNTTSGGSFWHEQFGGSQTFTFATPIDSFGAYFTGWQVTGQTLTLTYADSSIVVLAMPAGNAVGGTVFFGFIDSGAAIVSLTYNALNDITGIDDIRFGAQAAVPEPATLLLLGSGLAAAGLRRRRRKA